VLLADVQVLLHVVGGAQHHGGALVDVGGLDVQQAAGARGGHAPRLLHDEGHGVAFVQQPQLSGGGGVTPKLHLNSACAFDLRGSPCPWDSWRWRGIKRFLRTPKYDERRPPWTRRIGCRKGRSHPADASGSQSEFDRRYESAAAA